MQQTPERAPRGAVNKRGGLNTMDQKIEQKVLSKNTEGGRKDTEKDNSLWRGERKLSLKQKKAESTGDFGDNISPLRSILMCICLPS